MSMATPLGRDIKESDFGRNFEEVLHIYGWKAAHFRTSLNARGHYMTAVSADGKGWLDYWVTHPETGAHFAAELKVRYNKPTPEQLEWKAWHEKAGIAAFVWWPKDWPEMVAILAARQTPVTRTG